MAKRFVITIAGAAFVLYFVCSAAVSAQTLMTLYSFAGGSDGAEPRAGLIADATGALYGTTQAGANGYGTVFKLTPPVATGGIWTETVLHSFSFSDGAHPLADLIADATGALYGTTSNGGHSDYGTVFKLTPPTVTGRHCRWWPRRRHCQWTHTVLHSFSFGDGAYPYAGLMADATGALYGTTSNGGANASGTVFKLTPPVATDGIWTHTLLHSFGSGGPSNGALPYSALIADATGALYGTTVSGGALNYGTVFKLTPPAATDGTWAHTLLHSFRNSDGRYPHAGVIADVTGALYGTTNSGGAFTYGTAFKLTPPAATDATWTHTVLHSFAYSGGDGAFPYAGLIADATGALYGTTSNGGASGSGTVFKLTPSAAADGTWTYMVVHSFFFDAGAYPHSALIVDATGALYGTTSGGGASRYGTVFKLARVPGEATCIGQGISSAAKQYGGLLSAAAALGYASVADLENAVLAYCGG